MFACAVVQKPVLSPCTGVCRLDDAGFCVGCRRTGDEIANWLQFNDAQRLHLMNEVLPRRANAEGDAA